MPRHQDAGDQVINTDFTKAAKDIAAVAKDATYVVIGAGVLGYQQAQVQRQELMQAPGRAQGRHRGPGGRRPNRPGRGPPHRRRPPWRAWSSGSRRSSSAWRPPSPPWRTGCPPRPATWPSRPTSRPRRPGPRSARGSRPSPPDRSPTDLGPTTNGPARWRAVLRVRARRAPLLRADGFTRRWLRASRRARRPGSGPAGSPASTRWRRPDGPGRPGARAPRPAGPAPGRSRTRASCRPGRAARRRSPGSRRHGPSRRCRPSPGRPDSTRSR